MKAGAHEVGRPAPGTPIAAAGAPRRSACPVAWLEAATGVRLVVTGPDELLTITVAGELDLASLDVIESVARAAVARAPARVELDLRGVSFIDDDGVLMVARACTYARLRQIPFLIARPPDV
ncbi:MAG TPA: STAS domain-containing protein [Solirubrobacteraceae bacterium]|nr:STAS domain-containing protein [Solirubrobacteraceae bacterium]